MADPIMKTNGATPAFAAAPNLASTRTAFNALPDELIARIFSNIQWLAKGSPIPCVCRDFQRIFQDPVIMGYAYLENELKEKTTLTFDEISSYRTLCSDCPIKT